MGAGKAAEGHRIETLAGEAGIAHAIEVVHAGAVERHRQQTRQAQRRDWAVATAHPAQETAVGAGGADLLMANRAAQPRQDRFQALHQPRGIGHFLGLVVRGTEGLPGLDVTGGEGVHDVPALRCQGGIEQRGDRDEDHALLAFHLGPVFKQQVVAVEAFGDH